MPNLPFHRKSLLSSQIENEDKIAKVVLGQTRFGSIHTVGPKSCVATMREFLYSHVKLEHLLCILILVSRLGDIGSTYLVTPKLKLEANPIVRKFGWWFAIATMLLCLIPYYSTGMGIIVLIPSLMVSASNTAKIWFARAYGESEYQELLLRLARKTRLSSALSTCAKINSELAWGGECNSTLATGDG